MALIDWEERFCVGIASVDHEHREMIRLINDLHERLGGGGSVAEFLGEVYTRISAHFALEERFMQDTNFPNYGRHKREHDSFLNVIVDFIEDFRTGPELSHGDALEAQLQTWILNHITTSDQELVSPKAGAARQGDATEADSG